MYQKSLRALSIIFFLSISICLMGQEKKPLIQGKTVKKNRVTFKLQPPKGKAFHFEARKPGPKVIFLSATNIFNDTILNMKIVDHKAYFLSDSHSIRPIISKNMAEVLGAIPWFDDPESVMVYIEVTDENCACLSDCGLCVECHVSTGGGNCPMPGDDIEMRLIDYHCVNSCINQN